MNSVNWNELSLAVQGQLANALRDTIVGRGPLRDMRAALAATNGAVRLAKTWLWKNLPSYRIRGAPKKGRKLAKA